jgi:hypothetical protein
MTHSHSLLPRNSGAEAVETATKAVCKWKYRIKETPDDMAARANMWYKKAVSWESEESSKLKDRQILLSIFDVFQKELDKKFTEHQFNKAEVKKYLEEATGDLITARQLLFKQSTLYGTKSKKKQNSKSAAYAESGNVHPPKFFERYYEK